MSTEWTPLVPLAMIGTERDTASRPTWPGDVGALAAQVLHDDTRDANSAATRVLRAAAVLAACGLAGANGVAWPDAPAPGASEDSLATTHDATLLTRLTWALHHGPAPLQHEVCHTLARAGHRLPYALLPQALDLGRRSLALRPALALVIGARGVWLAAQRDEWSYAAGVTAEATDDTRWADGSFEQRLALLQEERAADPIAMRTRLAAALDDLAPKERAAFAEVLADRIGIADEPLLERLRADRSREVRQVALGLLLRLPAAAHVQRAITRVEPLLKHERALLRKHWIIDAPAAPGADWKDANLEATRPKNDTLGERAWWLYQLVRQVPLAWWTQHTGMTAADLLAWAGKTDWSEALWRGWRDVLVAAPEDAWCDALLDQWPAPLPHRDREAVLALLTPASRERHWLTQLRDTNASVAAIVSQAIAVCPAGETLSAALSNAFVDRIRDRLAQKQIDAYTLRTVLPDLCATLHPTTLDRMTDWPRTGDETPAISEVLHDVTQIIAVRHALRTFTSPGRPS